MFAETLSITSSWLVAMTPVELLTLVTIICMDVWFLAQGSWLLLRLFRYLRLGVRLRNRSFFQ